MIKNEKKKLIHDYNSYIKSYFIGKNVEFYLCEKLDAIWVGKNEKITWNFFLLTGPPKLK